MRQPTRRPALPALMSPDVLDARAPSLPSEAAGRNRLADESSPYLKRHAGQDIRWWAWTEDAFGLARRLDKPVLVSIGYLACFWCHVMAEETFADPRVVALINRDFVAIKVDREERPDVDRSVLDALAQLGARTGWPVTAFMTPHGDVYAGGSYFPPEPRHGLPGFLAVLDEASRHYRASGGLPDGTSRRPQSTALPPGSAVADIESFAAFLANRLLESVDHVYGGFGQTAPRFPHVSAHQLLWRRYVSTGTEAFGDAVVRSLSQICGSALYDAVGGGFHRYCADDAWSVPHFEKMLYDNAQLVELLSWVWRGTRLDTFKRCIEGTLTWALREMLIPGAGFVASLGACAGEGLSETEDAGSSYRWSEAEIRNVLGADADLFFSQYELCTIGDHPAGTLQRIERDRADDPGGPRLSSCFERLLDRRGARAAPARDDKIMADWNGLMIVTLIEAGSALDRRDWLASARQVFDDLTAGLSEGRTLRHCWTGGVLGPPGLLDDYATMSRAALRLHEAFGKQRYLELALAWVEVLDENFWDRAIGGYFMTPEAQWHPMARVKTITETSLPSGNGLMIGVLARLHELKGVSRYRDRAERLVETFGADMTRHGIAAATAVNAVLTLGQFVRIVVSGRPEQQATRDLLRAALDYSLPDRMVLGPGSGRNAPQDGVPLAQVCVGTACLLPITSAGELHRLTVPGGLERALASPAGSVRDPLINPGA